MLFSCPLLMTAVLVVLAYPNIFQNSYITVPGYLLWIKINPHHLSHSAWNNTSTTTKTIFWPSMHLQIIGIVPCVMLKVLDCTFKDNVVTNILNLFFSIMTSQDCVISATNTLLYHWHRSWPIVSNRLLSLL